MRALNFAYWLQGAVEIAGDALTSLDAPRVRIVKNHIKLVKQYDWENPNSEAHHLISWLEGVIDTIGYEGGIPKGISDLTYAAVKMQLAALFEHEVDPETYGDQKDEAQAIHDEMKDVVEKMVTRRPPGRSPSGGGGRLFMC